MKDNTGKKIIMPEDIEPEKLEIKETGGAITQKFTLNRQAQNVADAFGISHARKNDILQKLVAVASIYPRYSTVIEVFMNCTDKFTEKERMYGLFCMGRIKGLTIMAKMTNVKVRTNQFTMNREQKLLSLLSNVVVFEDKFLSKIMGKGV